jgi:tRNA (cmo5U34)-methyltransferase
VAGAGLGAGAPERILDLGAGTGMLSARLRAAYPAADLTLLDIAGQMLQRARDQLGDRGVSYLEADLLGPLPSGPRDCIASALAIHHLDDADKRALFARVRAGFREVDCLFEDHRFAVLVARC